MFRRASTRWSMPRSGGLSTNPTATARKRHGGTSPTSSASDGRSLRRNATTHYQRPTDFGALLLWESVSEGVDAKIREQIKAGVFAARLAADDWASSEFNTHKLRFLINFSSLQPKKSIHIYIYM